MKIFRKYPCYSNAQVINNIYDELKSEQNVGKEIEQPNSMPQGLRFIKLSNFRNTLHKAHLWN